MFQRHELPTRESGIGLIHPPRPRQDTLNSSGTDELDLHIPPPLVIDINDDGDMLQPLQISLEYIIPRNDDRTLGPIASYGKGDIHHWRFPVSLRFNELVGLGGFDYPVGIEFPETVFVVVRSSGVSHLPVWVAGVHLDGGLDAEVLHVSPCEFGSGEGRNSVS